MLVNLLISKVSKLSQGGLSLVSIKMIHVEEIHLPWQKTSVNMPLRLHLQRLHLNPSHFEVSISLSFQLCHLLLLNFLLLCSDFFLLFLLGSQLLLFQSLLLFLVLILDHLLQLVHPVALQYHVQDVLLLCELRVLSAAKHLFIKKIFFQFGLIVGVVEEV